MDDINGWLQLISNLAVLGGLVFLAFEVRHNTNVAKVQTHTELIQIGHDTHDWKLELQFAEVVVKATEDYESLTPAEKVQFSTFVFQLLNLWEHALGVHTRGLMSDTYWEAWNDTFHPNMKDPGWRSVWESVRPNFAAEFQRHVDQYV
jgi:hypothetical protein